MGLTRVDLVDQNSKNRYKLEPHISMKEVPPFIPIVAAIIIVVVAVASLHLLTPVRHPCNTHVTPLQHPCNTAITQVLQFYCDRHECSPDSIVLRYQGRKVQSYETPDDLVE
jgi:hypothetical protein